MFLTTTHTKPPHARIPSTLQRIEELIEAALADKHGTTPAQQREILLAKYAKSRR